MKILKIQSSDFLPSTDSPSLLERWGFALGLSFTTPVQDPGLYVADGETDFGQSALLDIPAPLPSHPPLPKNLSMPKDIFPYTDLETRVQVLEIKLQAARDENIDTRLVYPYFFIIQRHRVAMNDLARERDQLALALDQQQSNTSAYLQERLAVLNQKIRSVSIVSNMEFEDLVSEYQTTISRISGLNTNTSLFVSSNATTFSHTDRENEKLVVKLQQKLEVLVGQLEENKHIASNLDLELTECREKLVQVTSNYSDIQKEHAYACQEYSREW